jgi:carbamoyl-phosphate synthase large subunit
MTGGGGSGTIAASKFLKKNNYRVILGDMDKWAAGLKFSDVSYVIPAGKDRNFISAVRDIIRKEKVDIFVPLVDEELLKSYELMNDFPNLRMLLPQYDFTQTVLDKLKLVEALKNNGFPYPSTRTLQDGLDDLAYPVILKPRMGRGSRNVMEINNVNQIQAYQSLLGLSNNEILIQEKIIGTEFTISVVVNRKGNILAVVPKQIINKRGVTIAAITRHNKKIENICIDLQEKLKANGPFNVQLILCDDGTPVVFEINPRYSTTMALTIAAGVDEIGLVVEDKQNNDGLIPFTKDLVMTRFYDQIYFEEM